MRREWPVVLDLAGDVLVLDGDNSTAYTLRALAEQHVGRGQPSWGRRQETVLFADLVSSTQMATHFDPEFVRTMIRDYELACTPAILALGGHMHRFVGDGILASFGYPSAHEDDAGGLCRPVSTSLPPSPRRRRSTSRSGPASPFG